MKISDKNDKLAFACAAVSLIGLIIMLGSNWIDDAPELGIGSVESRMAGEKAVLCGVVKSKYDNGKDTVFLNISDKSGSISAVFFRDVKERVSRVEKNSDVCVEGNIQIYKGIPEIIGRKIINRTAVK